MPQVISGQRIGRAFLSPTGAANEVTQTLDFQLGAQDGVEITAVMGYGSLHDLKNLKVTTDASEQIPLDLGRRLDERDVDAFI